MTRIITFTPDEIEKFLKEQMAHRHGELVSYRGMGMDSFLLGRLEECKFICEHFGIIHTPAPIEISV